ncbi:RAD51B (predicted) [Pycnogonum litorale]
MVLRLLNKCFNLLSLGQLELINRLGLFDSQSKNLILHVSRICSPKPSTAWNLFVKHQNESQFISTNLPLLDNILCGGLPNGTLSELVGPPGCGKTQFCLMLSVLSCTLGSVASKINSNVIYIDTEFAFSAQRLIEIAKCRFPKIFTCHQQCLNLLANIFVKQPKTSGGLNEIFQNLETEIITKKIGLVVIDSIASLVRKEYGVADNIDRTNLLSTQALLLKQLAKDFNIPILLTNQITSSKMSTGSFTKRRKIQQCIVDEDRIYGNPSTTGEGSNYVIPSLGNTWSHCVNTRLVLQYVDETRRQITVVKSPLAPVAAFTYIIQDKGIVIEDSKYRENVFISFAEVRVRK